MAFSEDELLPLSALQHLVFCERQCALIHVEQAWLDNALTVEGAHLHERAHAGLPRRELRGAILTVRGLAIHSFRLGVSGVADIVEFHRDPFSDSSSGPAASGLVLRKLRGSWRPFPVEYKRGRPKADRCDEVQVCAQAMCLEEMLPAQIAQGALFYGTPQRRQLVWFDAGLRRLTEETAERLHVLFGAGTTPVARKQPKCRACSLMDRCRPDLLSVRRIASRYVQESIATILAEDGNPP